MMCILLLMDDLLEGMGIVVFSDQYMHAFFGAHKAPKKREVMQHLLMLNMHWTRTMQIN